MDFRTQAQLAEALGPDNQWFCSERHRRSVSEPAVLVTHYIKHGGAEGFARRYREAMGPDNRWFCSRFYGREVSEPETLWAYYRRATGSGSRP